MDGLTPGIAHFTAPEIGLRLGMGALLGIILGIYCELQGKPAGLRTHMLVSLSSALATLITLELYHMGRADGETVDPARIIQGIAQAIGLLSAGILIQGHGNTVRNLTTAASLWLAGAIGIACGAGFQVLAAIGLAIALAGLVVLTLVEARLPDRSRDQREDRRQP